MSTRTRTKPAADAALSGVASTKSQRSVADQQAALGVATRRREERLLAAPGKLADLKRQRHEMPRHLTLKELPEKQRFPQLRTTQKPFVDTIKLIAYRAETALVQGVREKLAWAEDARARVRQVSASAADRGPDPAAQTLPVRLHRLSRAIHDAALEPLGAELTATETVSPGTDLRLIYAPVGPTPIPRAQES